MAGTKKPVTVPTDPAPDPAPPDPDAPGNFVDDPDADEVPEPNEPA